MALVAYRRLIACLLFLCALSSLASVHARNNPAAPYLGIYEIYAVKKLEGGITSDAAINAWIGTQLTMSAGRFSVRNEKITKPVYRMERIPLPTGEGEVVSRDLTYFYGIGAERKVVCRILVFEGKNETEPLEQIEVLNNDRLVDIYDGRAFFYKKRSNAPSGNPPKC
jgi:hypothetical protein